jgi:hypothetical protein
MVLKEHAKNDNLENRNLGEVTSSFSSEAEDKHEIDNKVDHILRE